MRKTSVYLTDGELAALRRAARSTHRSQSDLIREGVHFVTSGRAFPGRDSPPEVERVDDNGEPKQKRPEWLNRQEEGALALFNARKTAGEIGKELGISSTDVFEVLGRVGAKLRAFSTPRTGDTSNARREAPLNH